MPVICLGRVALAYTKSEQASAEGNHGAWKVKNESMNGIISMGL
jgi:hypothetical protein